MDAAHDSPMQRGPCIVVCPHRCLAAVYPEHSDEEQASFGQVTSCMLCWAHLEEAAGDMLIDYVMTLHGAEDELEAAMEALERRQENDVIYGRNEQVRLEVCDT